MKFVCKSNHGALLLLNPPGDKKVISSRRRVVTYINEHFEKWLDFARGRWGMDADEDTLWFVSGTTKTTHWINAAFQGEYNGREGSVDCDVGNVVNVHLSFKINDEILSSAFHNHGPRNRQLAPPHVADTAVAPAANAGGPPHSCDQCIFIHYFRRKTRFWWRTKVIRAAAGPHDLPPPSGDLDDSAMSARGESPDAMDIEEFPLRTKMYDPVDVLLNYILENSEAEVAIACDRDIYAIFKDQEIPDDLQAGIEALQPEIDVDESGVGTIVVEVELPTAPDVASPTIQGVRGAAPSDSDDLAEPEDVPVMEAEPGDGPGDSEEGDSGDELTKEEAALRRQGKQPDAAGEAHTGSVTSLAVSPDSKWVASGSDDTAIILWDVEGQVMMAHRWPDAHHEIVSDLAFSPDNRYLASAGGDSKIRIWDVDARNDAPHAVLEGHTETIHTVLWSPDGTKLVSGSDDMTVRIWDAATFQQLHVLSTPNAMVTFVIISSDGTMLASGGTDYNCRIWDVATGALRYDLRGHKGMVWTAAFDPECRRVASGSDDGSVRIWRVSTGDELVILHEHHGPVSSVAFSSDGKKILSASSDSTVKVCDSFSGEKLLSLDGHDSMVNSARFSPDDRYIASASSDNTLRLWKTSDGSCVRTFNEHDDKVVQALFSSDGRLLSSGSDDGTVRIRVLSEWVQE
ncbi:WD40-repeat-containing domain protein [Earliella scabrosa]|nr:WD40-repeat-containing domain protein [Earliella scabrosa]